ncbi:MAG: tetratricopeptide repeat protein [Elusimicrobia bacterium]|nr:tetratricopeptide repeat protein [Elusimicrobiota bacterium]
MAALLSADELRVFPGGTKLKLPPAANKLDARGIELLAQGSYEEALVLFDRSLKIARKNPRARANRGVTLARLGRLDEALRDYKAAIALAPAVEPALRAEVVDGHVRRGRARFDLGKVKDALDDFYAAIRADRQDPRGYAAVARAARDTRQYETCVTYASRAAELGSKSEDVLTDKAACKKALRSLPPPRPK